MQTAIVFSQSRCPLLCSFYCAFTSSALVLLFHHGRWKTALRCSTVVSWIAVWVRTALLSSTVVCYSPTCSLCDCAHWNHDVWIATVWNQFMNPVMCIISMCSVFIWHCLGLSSDLHYYALMLLIYVVVKYEYWMFFLYSSYWSHFPVLFAFVAQDRLSCSHRRLSNIVELRRLTGGKKLSAICDMSRKASKTASGKAADADLLLNVCFVLVDWLLISAAMCGMCSAFHFVALAGLIFVSVVVTLLCHLMYAEVRCGAYFCWNLQEEVVDGVS